MSDGVPFLDKAVGAQRGWVGGGRQVHWVFRCMEWLLSRWVSNVLALATWELWECLCTVRALRAYPVNPIRMETHRKP